MKVTLRNDGTVNRNRVEIGDVTLYFSYETIVAYSSPGDGIVCCQNDWSNTTGKYLNMIEPDKKKRIPRTVFQERLDKVLLSLDNR